jgi:hypothetical protein
MRLLAIPLGIFLAFPFFRRVVSWCFGPKLGAGDQNGSAQAPAQVAEWHARAMDSPWRATAEKRMTTIVAHFPLFSRKSLQHLVDHWRVNADFFHDMSLVWPLGNFRQMREDFHLKRPPLMRRSAEEEMLESHSRRVAQSAHCAVRVSRTES